MLTQTPTNTLSNIETQSVPSENGVRFVDAEDVVVEMCDKEQWQTLAKRVARDLELWRANSVADERKKE